MEFCKNYRSKCVYAIMNMMNYFSSYNLFPTDETSQAYRYSVANSWQTFWRTTMLPPFQTFTAENRHVMYIWAFHTFRKNISWDILLNWVSISSILMRNSNLNFFFISENIWLWQFKLEKLWKLFFEWIYLKEFW